MDYSVIIEDQSQQATPREYKVVKVDSPVMPWRIQNGATGEDLTGRRYFTQEQAEAAVAELDKYRSPKANDHKPGTIDSMDEERLLSKASPAEQSYWGWKAAALGEFEHPKKSGEPKLPEDQTPTGITTEQFRDLERKVKAMAPELPEATDKADTEGTGSESQPDKEPVRKAETPPAETRGDVTSVILDNMGERLVRIEEVMGL